MVGAAYRIAGSTCIILSFMRRGADVEQNHCFGMPPAISTSITSRQVRWLDSSHSEAEEVQGTNDKAGSVWNLTRWTPPRAMKENLSPPSDYRYLYMGNIYNPHSPS